MLDPELELNLRAAINPIYEDVRGTESYERKRLLAEIDRLRGAGHRMAIELECLLMDTKDLPTQSRWWDTALDAVSEWQNLFPYNGPRLGD